MLHLFDAYYEFDRAVNNQLKLINHLQQSQKPNIMTKVTIIGQEFKAPKKYTKIKFLQVLTGNYKIDDATTGHWSNPADWDNIELICRNYADGKDLMFCYDSPEFRADGVLYIGYFNEGLV
jgi:hypothetical protein